MPAIYLIPITLVSCLFLVFFLKRPANGLLFMIFLSLIWPNYIVYKAQGLPGMTPPRAITLVFMVAFYMIATCNRSYRLKLIAIFTEFKFFFIILLFYSVIQLLSSLFYSTELAGSIFPVINDFLMGPFLMILIMVFLDNQEHQKNLFSILILAFFVINVIGLLEFIHNGPLFSNYLITETIYTIIQEKSRGGSYRLMSVFSNSLVFSQMLVISLPLFIYAFLKSRRFMKWIFLLNITLTIFLLFNTGSRAALVLVTTSPLLYVYSRIYFKLTKKIHKYIIILVPLLFAITGTIYTASNINNFVTLTTAGNDKGSTVSTMERIRQLEIGIPALLKNPILGYGVGGGVKLMYPSTSIDNLYLTIALNTGLSGLFIFLLFNYMLFKKSFKTGYIGNREIYSYISIVMILLFFLILSIDTMMTVYYILVATILLSTRRINSLESNKT